MIDWISPAIPLFKAAHMVAIIVWVGGLLTLPLMLARHDPAVSAEDYRLIRQGSHLTYTMVVTPAAVVAVIAGTWLTFMREVFTPWMFGKLAAVALLVAVHAWIGHLVVRVGEEPETHRSPSPWLPLVGVLAPALLVLALVLAKPPLTELSFPDWASRPLGRQLPVDVPNR
ncbi:MAG TPA: CopD family protein [Brevundimonas sp.]|jgi:uncharacterized membrane protein|uniref:CopD family protein n=1 Tax=Brevundimonas sp. TaxID=1871086 RepID=UPI002E15854D|nr:CopD family protein [Brevundimonas sp.]